MKQENDTPKIADEELPDLIAGAKFASASQLDDFIDEVLGNPVDKPTE